MANPSPRGPASGPCPNLRVGILGGGQLARMTADAAARMGIETVVIDPDEAAPAGQVTRHIVGPLARGEALVQLARQIDVATLENEFVDLGALEYLAHHGVMVRPSLHTFALILDKRKQRECVTAAGLSATPFAEVGSLEDARAFASRHGMPVVLKTRSQGYDGRGVAIARDEAGLESAWERLGAGARPLLAEGFVDFERELAVMVVRNAHGDVVSYPVVETVQRDYVCHLVRAPAPVAADVAARARDVAVRVVEAIEGIGVHGVELFAGRDGRIEVNEIAPRPHNSGHYTMDACAASQFENHLRAVLGLPLAPAEMNVPAAVMVNLLGSRSGMLSDDAAAGHVADAAASVHLYGKRELRPGRKMGHVTAVATSLDEAESRATEAARALDL